VRFARFRCGRGCVGELSFLRGVGLMIRMAKVQNGEVMSDGDGMLVFW